MWLTGIQHYVEKVVKGASGQITGPALEKLGSALTSLQVRIICFHLHQAADATSNNCHIATIRFPDSDNSTQSPVC